MWDVFADEYLTPIRPLERIRQHVDAAETDDGEDAISAVVKVDGVEREIEVAATVRWRRSSTRCRPSDSTSASRLPEHALTAGDDASAVAYVETEIDGSTVWASASPRRSRRRACAPWSPRSTAPTAQPAPADDEKAERTWAP